MGTGVQSSARSHSARSGESAQVRTGKRPIRVLYVIGNLKMGGTEAHLVQLIDRIDRSRVEPRLLMLEDAADLMPVELQREVEPTALDIAAGIKGTLQALVRMPQAIRRIRPDVVQAYGYPADVLAGACAPLLPGVHVITTRRGNETRPRRHQYYNWTNKVVDLVACVSEASAQHSFDTEGLPADKTIVIPNGIDLTRYVAPDRTGPIRSIGTVQRLRKIKGIDLLLEAYTSLPDPKPVLKIAGPADIDYGREIQARYEGTPGIEFLGSVDDIPGFLRGIDLFVLPSRSEGMSNALLEALAMALPIVATSVGGNTEVLAGGEAGVLVQPDTQEIADGLRSLYESPERALEFGRKARARAEAEYDIDLMVRRHEELYERLVGGD